MEKTTTLSVEQRKPFRILALDGGGVRAIIQAVILGRLVKLYPNFLQDVDAFAGTSAGAIVSAALVVGVPPEEVIKFYEQEVGKIFSEGLYSKMISIGNTIGACYTNDELKVLLEKEIGDKKLSELSQKIVIPTFQLDNCHSTNTEDKQPKSAPHKWTPVFLHNFSHSNNSDTLLLDAVLRTTAAPTYFPIYQGYVDGGVVANNPSLAAVTTAIASGEMKLQDVRVLSLSTGNSPRGIAKEKYGNGNWGLFEWGPHIVDLLLDSSTEAIDYQCRCLLGDRYHRLDPLLSTDIGLDAAGAVSQLKELAEKIDLTDTTKWIEEHWFSDMSGDKGLSLDDFIISDDTPTTSPSAWRCNIM